MQNYDFPLALTYDDVLLIPQYSEINSRRDVSLKTKITPKIELDLPIISINMDTVTGPEMATELRRLGGISFYPRFKPPEEQAKEVKALLDAGVMVIPAIGIKESEKERVRELVKAGAICLTIDVAHGHLKASIDMIKFIKSKYPEVEVIAGVVGTYEGAKDLFAAGAETVRVGVGPGTICTTRQQTGFGVPQITATLEAVRAAREMGGIVITDGGMKLSGDIVKALAAGSNAVAVGSMLAATKEAPGTVIEFNGKLYKEYNGSTSKKEKLKQFETNSNDKHDKYTIHVEGVEALVPYKGTLEEVVRSLEAGIRSGYSYAGSRNIEELHKNAKFMRVTPISVAENGAHGVVVQ